MKRLVLTRHAEARMAERGLRLSWIEGTARDPDRLSSNLGTHPRSVACVL
jgi:hypothetical protein